MKLRLDKRTVPPYVVYASVVAVSVLIAVNLRQFNFIRAMELRALDAQFILRGKVKPHPDIVILAIDQKSYDNIRDLQIFWHPLYAQAIRAAAAAKARVMALDIAFSVPVDKWEPDYDRIMAEAVTEAAPVMPVIVGYPSGVTAKQEWPVPVNLITSALGLSAYINLTADSDSFVRRQELIAPPDNSEGGPPARSFALRIAEKYVNKDVEFSGSNLRLDGQTIPLLDNRQIRINFAGPPNSIPSVSLWDFLQAAKAGNTQQLRNWVEGKVVLVGIDHMADRFPTPFYTAFTGKRWTTSGVEIHANTLNTLLQHRYLTDVPEWGNGLALVAVAAGTVAATGWLGSVAAGLLLAGLWTTIIVTSHVLFRLGFVCSLVELLIACSLSLVLSGLYRLFTAHKKSELFGKALSVFVGRDVASTLARSGKIMLTGKYQFVTILFSDIRGFTSFCEEKDPAVVVEFLNAYLAKMVRIIHDHGGTVNKFIGDGILAVFADDDKGSVQGDHPLRAVRTGVAMCQAETGFQTGVGIHTGVVVIGNVGSEDRVEFTVLGDTVNVASRLESLNKEQHTNLIMSQATHDLLDDAVETELLGSVPVRGQTRSVKIYTASALRPHSTVGAGQ